MRLLIQRVTSARVDIAGETVGTIGQGLLILVGVTDTDAEAEAVWTARKAANLRIFPDDDGRMNRSVIDVGGQALVVSQFTLYGTVGKGNRPSYNQAAGPDHAEALYDQFVEHLAEHIGRPVETGRFGANMQVHLVNDGPVTIWVERGA
ncbi:MAG: D-aminoacyl-tRNA deacylase [Bacteroidota bacterium]